MSALRSKALRNVSGNCAAAAKGNNVKESRRLLEVLERRLVDRDWLMGAAVSIADMATYPWTRSHFRATVDVEGLPNLRALFDRLDVRPRTQAALQLPEPRPSAFGDGDFEAAASLPMPLASRSSKRKFVPISSQPWCAPGV